MAVLNFNLRCGLKLARNSVVGRGPNPVTIDVDIGGRGGRDIDFTAACEHKGGEHEERDVAPGNSDLLR
jgi:hypothetical protein